MRFFEHRFQFIDKVAGIFEFAIDARKANVGDLIELAKTIHNPLTDIDTFDFRFEFFVDVVFDLGNDPAVPEDATVHQLRETKTLKHKDETVVAVNDSGELVWLKANLTPSEDERKAMNLV